MSNEEQTSELVPSTYSDDDEVEPMTGQPYFCVTLTKSQLSPTYRLFVPVDGVRILPNQMVPVTLTRGTKRWEMNYLGKYATHKRFDGGWRQFAVDNALRIGDVCVVERMTPFDVTPVVLKVQILRGDFPSGLLDKGVGTSDNPIFVE